MVDLSAWRLDDSRFGLTHNPLASQSELTRNPYPCPCAILIVLSRDPRILPASRPGIPRIHLRFPLLLYPGLLLRWYRRGPFGPRPYQRLQSPPHALRTANAASHRQREQRSYSLGGYYCAKQYLAVIPRNHGPLFLFLNSLLLVHI